MCLAFWMFWNVLTGPAANHVTVQLASLLALHVGLAWIIRRRDGPTWTRTGDSDPPVQRHGRLLASISIRTHCVSFQRRSGRIGAYAA